MRLWVGLIVLAAGLSGAVGCAPPGPVRVLSFNIRYDNPQDGLDAWSHRKPDVVALIRSVDADLIGLQEALPEQVDYLRAALDKDYGFVGVGRDDGARRGEFVPVFYRKRRFELRAAGHFWLSPKPSEPGSVGWDAALPRMATWVRLAFRENTIEELQFINTHFDHRGEQARLESAKLLRRTVEALGGVPTIVVGDFNCGPASPPHAELVADRRNLLELFDVFEDPHVTTSDDPPVADGSAGASRVDPSAGTFHGFTGRAQGPRIDWILTNRRFKPTEASLITAATPAGRYPSDHFPVTATLTFQSAQAAGR